MTCDPPHEALHSVTTPPPTTQAGPRFIGSNGRGGRGGHELDTATNATLTGKHCVSKTTALPCQRAPSQHGQDQSEASTLRITVPGALASLLAVILRPHKPHASGDSGHRLHLMGEMIMQKNLQVGASFCLSSIFPFARTGPAGIFQIDIDCPLSVAGLCHSPVGVMAICRDDTWITQCDWANRQVPRGKWNIWMPNESIGFHEDQLPAPMAMILALRIMLRLTGQEDLAKGHPLSGGEHARHFQHTNGSDALLYCYIRKDGLLGFWHIQDGDAGPIIGIPLCAPA